MDWAPNPFPGGCPVDLNRSTNPIPLVTVTGSAMGTKNESGQWDQWRLIVELHAKHTFYYLLSLNPGVYSPTSCSQ